LVIVISKDPLIFTKYFKGTKFDENAEQNLVQVNPETKVEELPVEDISNNETITKTENNNKV
jgi:hypothetical protein